MLPLGQPGPIINAILLKLTDALTDQLKIDGFAWAPIAALVISVMSTLGQWLLTGARGSRGPSPGSGLNT